MAETEFPSTKAASDPREEQWRTQDHRDLVRYHAEGNSDSWQTCIKLAHYPETYPLNPALRGQRKPVLVEYQEAREKLDQWMEQAAEALASGSDEVLHGVHPVPPATTIHLSLPPLLEWGEIDADEVNDAIRLQNSALTLSIRLHAKQVMASDGRNGDLTMLSARMNWARASGVEVDSLSEVEACGAVLERHRREQQLVSAQLERAHRDARVSAGTSE